MTKKVNNLSVDDNKCHVLKKQMRLALFLPIRSTIHTGLNVVGISSMFSSRGQRNPSIHMWSRSQRDQWKLLTINDCLHKFSRVVNLHSFHCVYTYAEVASIQKPSFNTNGNQLSNARPRNDCRPALWSTSTEHKGQVLCNPTELFHPYPKGHLANYLPKHILKLQIIGAVWY